VGNIGSVLGGIRGGFEDLGAKAEAAAQAASGAVQSRAADVAAALRLLAQKATEAVDPAAFQAQDDAAIAAISDAIRRHDEPAVAAILEKAGPRLAGKLWDADLPQWVDPAETLDTLKTAPGEAWRVKWNYDFDEKSAMDGLIGRWIPPARQLGNTLTYVKKRFPADEQDAPDHLSGGTSFGYDPKAAAGSGGYTPNDVRMTSVTNERTGAPMPVALMTYEEPPWFTKATGTGFNDEFKALTPNIILARGWYSEYGDADLHGAAAGPRPPLSQALASAAGGERAGVSPDLIRFWMYRMKDGDPAETPVFGGG
jgi:hypothetical protein